MNQKRILDFVQRNLLCLLLLGSLVSANCMAFEEKVPRYALIIGNSDYRISPLKNAQNDAVDMASALEELDYRVTVELNLSEGRFTDVVRRFYQQIESPKAITLFYYAGHAVQLDNTNYLIPLNAPIIDVDSLQRSAFVLDELLRIIKQSKSKQNILILDACRDNPFEHLSNGNQTLLGNLAGGLAPVEAPANTLVAYATEPGNVSSDGKGRNGVYTAALLRHIDKSIPAEELFKHVRNDVIRATGNQQIPWEHSSLTQEFYFGQPLNQSITDIISF